MALVLDVYFIVFKIHNLQDKLGNENAKELDCHMEKTCWDSINRLVSVTVRVSVLITCVLELSTNIRSQRQRHRRTTKTLQGKLVSDVHWICLTVFWCKVLLEELVECPPLGVFRSCSFMPAVSQLECWCWMFTQSNLLLSLMLILDFFCSCSFFHVWSLLAPHWQQNRTWTMGKADPHEWQNLDKWDLWWWKRPSKRQPVIFASETNIPPDMINWTNMLTAVHSSLLETLVMSSL